MIFLFFVLLFFILLQGFFAASEMAYISSSLIKLRHRAAAAADRGHKAEAAYKLISQPEKFFATTLMGINISAVISSSIITYILIRLNVQHSTLWTTIFFTPVIVIFAELIPKNAGRIYREDFACGTGHILNIFKAVFHPLIAVAERITLFFVKVIFKKTRKRSQYVTKEELKSLIREVERQGVLEQGEKEAIEDVFSFRFRSVKDSCTPFSSLTLFDIRDGYNKIMFKAKTSGYTRYPVLNGKEITGYVNIYDLFYSGEEWKKQIRPIMKVGENQKLYDVLKSMQKRKETIALVLKGRKTIGIVTLNDLIKEIISSIAK